MKGGPKEIIINDVLHNPWISGNEPRILVSSDCIEILSRGMLAPTQTLEGFFLEKSIPVNEKLSEIFLQPDISEKSGRATGKFLSEGLGQNENGQKNKQQRRQQNRQQRRQQNRQQRRQQNRQQNRPQSRTKGREKSL